MLGHPLNKSQVPGKSNPPFSLAWVRLSRSSAGRPSLYPPGTETTVLKVPKRLKERLQQIGIALAWGDKGKSFGGIGSGLINPISYQF